MDSEIELWGILIYVKRWVYWLWILFQTFNRIQNSVTLNSMLKGSTNGKIHTKSTHILIYDSQMHIGKNSEPDETNNVT